MDFQSYRILPEYSKYLIYSDGRIFSLSKKCFLRQCENPDGYLLVNVISQKAKNGYRHVITAHRLVAMAFCENPNGYKEVNHKDGNKKNNNYTNLEWCTRSENLSHCHKLGLRSSKGVNNGNYKNGKYVIA